MGGMTKDVQIAVSKIMADNDNRRNEMFAHFNPITGEGSVGERVIVSLPDFPIKKQWLPASMIDNAFVKALVENKGIDGFLQNNMGVVEPTLEERRFGRAHV